MAFDEEKYKREWQKENMSTVIAKYNKSFVDEFKEACKKLDTKQSTIIRKVMEETIKKAEIMEMTKQEIREEIEMDLEKAYENKNEARYWLEQLPMEEEYDETVNDFVNKLENEVRHQNREDFDFYVDQLIDYYYNNYELYFN